MSESPNELTPLLKQYYELKKEAGDAFLLFRMGDFYELFGDDAVEAAKILDLTLTSRDKNKENPLPMAGMPHHSAQSYIQKLLDCGKKVAIGEQTEDPEEAKKRGGYKAIVRREIVRVLSPAVQFESHAQSEQSFLATVYPSDKHWVLAAIEPSTGETLLSSKLDEEELYHQIVSLPIKHFLRIDHRLPLKITEYLISKPKLLLEELSLHRVSKEKAETHLMKQFQVLSLESFLDQKSDFNASTLALGFLLDYLFKSQNRESLPHLKSPKQIQTSETLLLGPNTSTHLDLIPHDQTGFSLFEWMNETKTSFGSRKLKAALLSPLKKISDIHARQKATQTLEKNVYLSESLNQSFTGFLDLERILGRIATGLATPRDTRALGIGLKKAKEISDTLYNAKKDSKLSESTLLESLCNQAFSFFPKCSDLSEHILKIQKESPPFLSREGEIFNAGFHPELDHLIDLTANGQKYLIDLEAQERESTGISNLKVRYNRVFGYYIEITQMHLKNVPSHYQRKQTTAGGERFFTEELKKFEVDILSAEEKKKALEMQLFSELVEHIKSHSQTISGLIEVLAECDMLLSFSKLKDKTSVCYPIINDSKNFQVEAGRHPLVDKGNGNFIPNSIHLNKEQSTLLITGPNMGGKSTVMRQFALLIVMGQMGAPIPARSAEFGVFDALYTRIGANDAIARGQSTFMVEMTELSHILHHATDRSFILLDEIGRGTSTYDGLSVAWSAIEHISSKIKARTLFATHYHELTELPETYSQIKNAHMGVQDQDSTLRFEYLLKDGPSNDSYGIQVAQLAGLPKEVIQHAKTVLHQLEKTKNDEIQTTKPSKKSFSKPQKISKDQMSLFDQGPALFQLESENLNLKQTLEKQKSLLHLLESIDVNQITPLEALMKLSEMKNKL